MENINIIMDIYFNSKCSDETIAFRQSSIDNIKKFILTFRGNEELVYMVDVFNSKEKSRRCCRSLKDAMEMEMEFMLYYTDSNHSNIMKYFRKLLSRESITNQEYEKITTSISMFCGVLLHSRVIDVIYKKYNAIEYKPIRDFINLFIKTNGEFGEYIYLDPFANLIGDDIYKEDEMIGMIIRFIRDNNLNFISNDLERYLGDLNSILLTRIENARKSLPIEGGYLDNLDSMLKKLALNLIKEDTND